MSSWVTKIIACSLVLVSIGFLYFSMPVYAEPWLANRHAQNCAGCHAPGRFNLPAIDRRCTLTCQGCHTSPQGGGARNQYGKWNQQRWMRSFISKDLLQNKGTPAPVSRQKYMGHRLKNHSKKKLAKAPKKEPDIKGKKRSKSSKGVKKTKLSGKKDKLAATKSKQSLKEARRNNWKKVPTLVVTREMSPAAENYDKTTYNEWEEAKSRAQFRSAIPEGDPYRLERSQSVYASGNFRYLYGGISGEAVPESLKELSFFMAADIGVRMRPIRKKLSFVVESRFDNGPKNKDIEDGFTSHAFARSAYILVDDLAWNSFVMAGIFRPMFGHQTADHTALAQRASGFSQSSTFKAFSIGAAPNVPYMNLSIIEPMSNGENDEKGLAVALGTRFVTNSLSSKLSMWKTEGQETKIIKTLYSWTAGGMFGRFILNGEFLKASQEIEGTSFHEGHIYTLEAKMRLWRETYFQTSFATANVSPTDLSKGDGQDLGVGLKIFGFPGTELDIMYSKKKETTAGLEIDWTYTQIMAHIFF